MEDSEDNDLFDYYMEIGVIELSGIDESGEIVFKVTDKAKDLAPELWKAHADYVDDTLLELYSKDLISVEYDENLQATISLTEEAQRIIEDKGIMPLDDN
jgi:membrane protease subunit (stomatin/prohibitin family)